MAWVASVLARRIESKELLTEEEPVKRLGVNRRCVTSELKAQRLFEIRRAPALTVSKRFTTPLHLNAGHSARPLRCFPSCPGHPNTTSL